MAATFNWKILNIECYSQLEDKKNVAHTINWKCTATEVVNGISYTDFVIRQTPLEYDPNNSFVEYDKLKEAQVLGWVWNHIIDIDMNVTTKQAIEVELQLKLNAKITPLSVTNAIPWN